jgi:hypothetical protein
MEIQEGNNMAMNFIPDAELLPTVVVNPKLSREVRHEENINGLTNLDVTKCIGETDANLDAIIAHYAQTITKYNMRNLGRLLVVDIFLSLDTILYHKIPCRQLMQCLIDTTNL